MLKGYGLKSYLQAGGGGGRVICNLGRLGEGVGVGQKICWWVDLNLF